MGEGKKSRLSRKTSGVLWAAAIGSLSLGVWAVTSWRGALCTLGISGCVTFLLFSIDHMIRESAEFDNKLAIDKKDAEYRSKTEYEQRAVEMRRQEREDERIGRVR